MPATKLKEMEEPIRMVGYDQDFHAWALDQADALRSGRFAQLDRDHLAEEIEDLGREVFSKLASSFRIILTHLLKWDHQPERRSRSWAGSIETHRLTIEDILSDNPSLRRRQADAIRRGYRQARIKAAVEMRRDKSTLPVECPYSLAEILERPIEWPQS
jgi:hypothetical protein